MTPIYEIQSEVLTYLNEWSDFIWSLKLEENYGFGNDKSFKAQGGKFYRENRSEFSCSQECLESMNHDTHDGFPPDSMGYDFNQMQRWMQHERINPELAQKCIEKSNWLDQTLGNYMGSRFCALKMWYPTDGYIAWHTNWNVPGYNILMTYNPEGDGYFRFVDPSRSTGHKPRGKNKDDAQSLNDSIVTIPDKPGWSMKVGYYGKKEEHDKILWHSAYSKSPRINLGYVVFDVRLWKDMVEELTGEEFQWPIAELDYSKIEQFKYDGPIVGGANYVERPMIREKFESK